MKRDDLAGLALCQCGIKYAGDPDAIIEVPEGGSLADMVRLQGDKELGDKMPPELLGVAVILPVPQAVVKSVRGDGKRPGG